jgi:hypothetical protein
MKIFIVWYLAGMMGGAVGPMPKTFAECEASLPGTIEYLRDTTPLPPGYSIDDFVFKCEWHRRFPL